jgi:hypothetical protein
MATNNKAELQKLINMYSNLSYFDDYGATFFLFIFINIVVFSVVSYCHVKINAQPIIDDWPNQRCKINIIPIAGFITHPEGVTAIDYTATNFNYCMQGILSSISGFMVEPISFIISTINNVLNLVKEAINDIRGMFNKVRTFFQTIAQEIMGKVLNIMVPLQQIIISFRDLIGKIQGIMTAGLFTFLGTYYTLQSLLGAIAQFIIIILIALAALIIIFWIIPFTWGVAISSTVVFLALSIPLAIMLVFMEDVLQVQPSLSIPGVPSGPSTGSCFDGDTLLVMNNGEKRKIREIKLGDKLLNNNEVTGLFKLDSLYSKMYKLDDIIISGTHVIKYNNQWITISKHPKAIELNSYDKPYLYCLNTTHKTISIDNHLFIDWDEIYENVFEEIKSNGYIKIEQLYDIHYELDSGFSEFTKIKLKNGSIKEIKDIKVNDVLVNGEKVYGLVKVDGKKVKQQYRYNLGKDLVFEGGPNITICDTKVEYITTLDNEFKTKQKLDQKHNILYHLLTDKKTFKVGDIKFYDYNASIDIFLEKNKVKLLSMKYV